VTAPGDDRARLEARNAAMKNQVDSLLEQFEKQTEQLRDAQAAAAETSATVTSPDGLVRATIDSTGSLAQLDFAPSAFERSTPAALANATLKLVRHGTLQVKQQVADLMAPITQGLPDLSDLIEGAPSLQGLLPKIPDFLEEEEVEERPRPESFGEAPILRNDQPPPPPPSMPAPKPTPARRTRPEPEVDEELPASWMTRGDS
jgi:DNA-binding protein YbaB